MSKLVHTPISAEFQNMLLVMSSILTCAAESSHYSDNWGQDFALENVKEGVFNTGWKPFEFSFKISDFQKLHVDHLYYLGFRQWNETQWMIPLWIVKFIDENEMITCIDGSKVAIRDADHDTRAGCIAYFFTPFPDELEILTSE